MAKAVKGWMFRRGRVYWCRYKHHGVLHRFSLKTEKESHARHELERLMLVRRAAIEKGTHDAEFGKGEDVPPVRNGNDLSLTVAWQRYLQCRTRPQSGDSTIRQYQYQVNDFVSWMSDQHPEVSAVSGVTRDMAHGFLHYLESQKHVASGTYNKYVDTLRRTFRFLKEEADAISANPWDGIRHKKKAVNRRKPFTPDEARLILASATGWMRTLFFFGFYTGQRLVDCCTLKWDQFDFTQGMVEVMPMKTRNSSGLRVELPIHADLRRHLDELRPLQGSNGFVLAEIAERYLRDPASVVVMIRDFLIKCGFRVHRDGTGANGVRAVPQYGFHSCRHTFVSVCRNAGVPDSVVQSVVGESYRLYSHVDREAKRRAIDQLPSLGGELESASTALPSVDGLGDADLERMLDRLQAEAERRRIGRSTTKVA